MRITIINGPNLNLLGKREPGIYGNATFGSVLDKLRDSYRDIDIEYFQSNHEGDIIDGPQGPYRPPAGGRIRKIGRNNTKRRSLHPHLGGHSRLHRGHQHPGSGSTYI